MVMNTRIYRRTEIYAKEALSYIDNMYFHQSMKGNYSTDFLKASQKEFCDLPGKEIFEMIPNSIVPGGGAIFPEVWAMKRKRRVQTREIYKYKAQLNLDRSKMRSVVHYNHTNTQLSLGSTLGPCCIQYYTIIGR